MAKTKLLTIIEIALSVIFLTIGLVGYFSFSSESARQDKAIKKKRILFLVLGIIAAWFLIGTIITYLSGKSGGMHIEFNLFSKRVSIFGISFAETTVVSWVIIGIVLILSIIFKLFIFPKFNNDNPRGVQNVLELAVEACEGFTKNNVVDYSETLSPYIFSLAVFMVLGAFSELLGFRPPTSDIIVTLSMGLITFFLLNYFGIKKKGVSGRLKALAKPVPVIFPMKVLSDIAVPISLACRLFGNMVGGMIVMELLKSVLGGYAEGIPAVAGLYFNLFHPVIQTYIFIILSLTFINEAIE